MSSTEDGTVHKKGNNNSACGFMIFEELPCSSVKIYCYIHYNGELETS